MVRTFLTPTTPTAAGKYFLRCLVQFSFATNEFAELSPLCRRLYI